MKLSIVIPAHNEEGCIEPTINNLLDILNKESITFEILAVNDNSSDRTEKILQRLCTLHAEVRFLNNAYSKGFGFAVRTGLENFKGDAVAIVMADGSDDPKDVVKFFKKLEEGYDCVFGSRFIEGGKTYDYPKFKLVINRFANLFIRMLFALRYNDMTNAFKMYRYETIQGLKPLLSHHFNLTVELPLKAITRGYSYAILPNSWTNRKTGESKLKIKEMGSRYLFIVLYCLIEKWLSVGDYMKGKQKQ
jgi:dolichol-phosphate mannosyltransferase